MSVAGYLGNKPGELRLKAGDLLTERVRGPVLEGERSVEDAQAAAARRARRPGKAYESTAHYDPVLRAHCRLDSERTAHER
jgi:hypothetical protein